jgi:hypothetical protein
MFYMKVHKTFEINNFFSLKLEEVIINGKSEKITNIYINGEKFIKCKYLLFIDPQKNFWDRFGKYLLLRHP